MRLSVLFSLLLPITTVAACHSHDDYADFQACFTEHTDEEGYDPPMAITICALDHEIGGSNLDFATAEECVTYMNANLVTGSATAAEIDAGCADYILQKDK